MASRGRLGRPRRRPRDPGEKVARCRRPYCYTLLTPATLDHPRHSRARAGHTMRFASWRGCDGPQPRTRSASARRAPPTPYGGAECGRDKSVTRGGGDDYGAAALPTFLGACSRHVAMHTWWLRANNVIFYGLTVLFGLSCAAAVTWVALRGASAPHAPHPPPRVPSTAFYNPDPKIDTFRVSDVHALCVGGACGAVTPPPPHLTPRVPPAAAMDRMATCLSFAST